MEAFAPGQRWFSSAEPELGLGTVLRLAGRQVQIVFTGTGIVRMYALGSAPLLRAAAALELLQASALVHDDPGGRRQVWYRMIRSGVLGVGARTPPFASDEDRPAPGGPSGWIGRGAWPRRRRS